MMSAVSAVPMSMLDGTAPTADIMGVVPDHRRDDRAADRPPIADARSALHGTRA